MSEPTYASVTLRPLGPCDRAVAAALHAASFEQAWSETSMTELLAMPGSFGLLAMAGELPIGLAIVLAVGQEAEILTLGIVPDFRRRGVGRLLLSAVADRLARAGVARLTLEVSEDNFAAQALYRATGFLEAGRRTGYYVRANGGAVDAILLARAIDANVAVSA